VGHQIDTKREELWRNFQQELELQLELGSWPSWQGKPRQEMATHIWETPEWAALKAHVADIDKTHLRDCEFLRALFALAAHVDHAPSPPRVRSDARRRPLRGADCGF
jgi:hypothetical protein